MKIYDNVLMDFSKGNILVLKDGFLQLFDLKKWLSDTAPVMKVADSKAGLTLPVLTSASGTLINARVYPGKEWKRVAKDFAGKPVLKHHDVFQDAIGRINKGWFEQLSKGDEFDNDYVHPAVQGKGQPSGYVWTECNITDPDAIQKISDERLLHVSQGCDIEKAICSICASDWAAGHYCEHKMGEMNDVEEGKKKVKKMAFFQTWGLAPGEVSAVNRPAFKQAAFQVPKDASDQAQEAWGHVNDFAARELCNSFGTGVGSFRVRDFAGQETELMLQPRETIILSQTPSNPPETTPDTPPVPDVGSETDMELKEAIAKIEALEAEKAALVKSGEDLRKKSGELEKEGKDALATLKVLQEAHDKLMGEQHKTVVDNYLKEASVEETAADATRKKLAGLDIGAIQLLTDEVSRVKKLIKPAAPAVAPVTPLAEANKGGTTEDKDNKAKPAKAVKTTSPLLRR